MMFVFSPLEHQGKLLFEYKYANSVVCHITYSNSVDFSNNLDASQNNTGLK